MNKYLYDEEFLKLLSKHHTKTTYARITALSWDELPLERIEGKITGGTVNLDGSSALRRTCSLTMISNEVNIQNYYWGLQSKFKLEVGLENTINDEYPEIVWFPQGLFIITGFNTNVTVNNCTITIQGKDKMCLLNGDIGGSLPSQIDFGIDEYYDADTQTTTYNSIPLKDIIYYAVNAYGGEPFHNIVINDLDMLGLEQVRYKGDKPLFFVRPEWEANKVYTNITLNENMKCSKNQDEAEKQSNLTLGTIQNYNKDMDAIESYIGDNVYFLEESKEGKKYTKGPYSVYKAEYGDDIGYRPTQLTYAGELIANAGESLTSVLDKIRNMLGSYEYFYDLDGRFIFQKKKTYDQNPWNSLIVSTTNSNDTYAENAVYVSQTIFNFNDLGYFTALTHNPTLNNLKNDFSVWGNRKGITGQEIPIHLRYVLDKKPVYYKNYNNEIYISDEGYFEMSSDNCSIDENIIKNSLNNDEELYKVDWREIIYQMAYDYYNHHDEEDFLSKVAINNRNSYNNKGVLNRYPSGLTGYENYYIDIYSFWREIYDPRVVIADFPDSSQTYYKWSPPDNKYVEFDGPVYEFPEYDTEEGKYYKDAYELVGGSYKEPEDTKGYLINFETTDLSKYYQKVEYQPIGVRTHEQYLKKQKEYEKILDEKEKEKNDYYVIEDNEYIGCFFWGKEWADIKNRTLYQFIEDSTKFIPYNFYVWAAGEKEAVLPNNLDCDINTHRSYKITSSPEQLDFWIDFIGEDTFLEKYLACNIGSRTKTVNDSDVTAIYFQEVPDVLYITEQDFNSIYGSEQINAYTQVRVNDALSNTFSISPQKKSAYEALIDLLDKHIYCIENITITSTPIYYLDVNSRIEVYDKESNIEGQYLISKITLPLTHNGTMQITATKAIDSIY